MHPRDRPLWKRRAETPEGKEVLDKARRLAWHPDCWDLDDGQLIRLAYWGASGDRDDGTPQPNGVMRE